MKGAHRIWLKKKQEPWKISNDLTHLHENLLGNDHILYMQTMLVCLSRTYMTLLFMNNVVFLSI